ncbi:small acid-soluble spore protein P [Paenibacillus zanthoxyli]|uniref:small acid-soluble spore protein P n=1 Tax=Paenibacillus zanthoxyli TaxID=369399 RepID=UPI00046FC5D7|nr:small acid-soluble spore protein P [Paenibacillus zanthoxyli]
MSKPKTIQVPGTQQPGDREQQRHEQEGPEPLSGSKKVKQANHVSHNNPQG